MNRSRWKPSARPLLFLALAAVLAASGCGNTGTVTGKVTYKGTPLKGGNVGFLNADGTVGTSPIAEDGTYTIPKMHTGEVKITVETESMRPAAGAYRAAKQMPKAPDGKEGPGGYKVEDPNEMAKRYVRIPANYAEPDKSGLKYTVKSGRQEYPINLD